MSGAVSVKSSKSSIDTSICSVKSDAEMCEHCKLRHAIIKRLKELFRELEMCNLLDPDIIDEPLDSEDVIPLITYPLKNKTDSSLIKKKENPKCPPWKLPRFPSQELIGGKMCNTCECGKRNGLQDYCQRSMCRGSLQCLHKPDPLCIPSGMWKKCVLPEEAKQILQSLNKIKEIGIDEVGNQKPQVPCSKCGHTVCKCHNKKTTDNKNYTKTEKFANPVCDEGKKRTSNKWDLADKQYNDYALLNEIPSNECRKKEHSFCSHN